jgi:hypothetical protein
MVPIGGPKSIGPGAHWGCPGDSVGFRPKEAPVWLGLEAALGGEDGAPPALGEFCAPPGFGGFRDSCSVYSVLGVEGLVAFRDSPRIVHYW